MGKASPCAHSTICRMGETGKVTPLRLCPDLRHGRGRTIRFPNVPVPRFASQGKREKPPLRLCPDLRHGRGRTIRFPNVPVPRFASQGKREKPPLRLCPDLRHGRGRTIRFPNVPVPRFAAQGKRGKPPKCAALFTAWGGWTLFHRGVCAPICRTGGGGNLSP